MRFVTLGERAIDASNRSLHLQDRACRAHWLGWQEALAAGETGEAEYATYHKLCDEWAAMERAHYALTH